MPLHPWAAPALLNVLLLASADPEGFRPLFNGKDLDGWVAEGQKEYRHDGELRPVWTVKDGTIVCTGRGFGFLRYDRQEFGDFLLHVEYRMAPRCNSGVGIRTTAFNLARSWATRPSTYGYEIQLLDDAGRPATAHSTGSLYRYVAPRENAARPASQWNSLDVECVGPRIKVVLNGKEVVDVDQSTLDTIKHKPLKGYVCLQNHGSTIAFRNIGIHEIRAEAGGSSASDRTGPAPPQSDR